MVYIIGSRLDPRVWLATGFTLAALSGFWMASFDMNVTEREVYLATMLGGFGPALVWPAIAVITFSTLAKNLMAEGAGLWQLLRNVGSSIHISISVSIVVRMAKANYSEMASSVSTFDERLEMSWVMGAWSIESKSDLATLSQEISRQALMIGYNDAFLLYAATGLVMLPLVFFVRPRKWTDAPP